MTAPVPRSSRIPLAGSKIRAKSSAIGVDASLLHPSMMARHRKPSVQWVACLVLFAVAGCISAEASGSVLTVPLRGLFETCFALPGQYANPFNASLILVQATFHTPSPTSDVEVVDGFWFQNYTHSLVNNVEELTAHGPPQWCVRYSPRVLGTYTYTINATDGLGSNVTNPSQFECTTEGAGAGFVAVAANQQHFAEVGTATPTTYWPVGENVAWTNATGTFAWHNYFQRMSKYGANYARLWLTDEYLGDVLALQTVRTWRCDDGLGGLITLDAWTVSSQTLGRYNLGNAWRLDVVMALARRFGMRTLMCTESFNLLCVDTCPFCKWPSSLFNVKNGGNLNQPQDFFTNPQSKALYKCVRCGHDRWQLGVPLTAAGGLVWVQAAAAIPCGEVWLGLVCICVGVLQRGTLVQPVRVPQPSHGVPTRIAGRRHPSLQRL